jgi:hypothetical protein
LTIFCCSDFLASDYYDYVGVGGHAQVAKGSPSTYRINIISSAALIGDQETFKHMLKNYNYSSAEKIHLLSLSTILSTIRSYTEITDLLMTHMTPLEIQEGLK